MRVFVTGSAGFIGSHLVDYLIKQGYEVIGIDNLIRGKREYINPKSEFIKADIRSQSIDRYLKGVDWIFHLAAIATTPWAMRDPILTNDINVNGTLNLLMAAKKAKIKRFVYSSSNVVYSEQTPYWVSKKAGENYTRVFNLLYGLSTISLRYSNVYGSLRANEENCIMALRKSWLGKGYVVVTGDGKQSRDFSHVSDIARANLLAAESQVCGEFDICTGVNTTLNEVAAIFKCPVKYVPDRSGDAKHIIQDPKPAWKKLGYKYSIKFNEENKIYMDQKEI